MSLFPHVWNTLYFLFLTVTIHFFPKIFKIAHGFNIFSLIFVNCVTTQGRLKKKYRLKGPYVKLVTWLRPACSAENEWEPFFVHFCHLVLSGKLPKTLSVLSVAPSRTATERRTLPDSQLRAPDWLFCARPALSWLESDFQSTTKIRLNCMSLTLAQNLHLQWVKSSLYLLKKPSG